jgi:2-dehydro-3-deoxy-D-gluconate 5-dehydrogenase
MTYTLFDLTAKVALVTGGNGGIGLGVARGLASAGAAIAVAGRNAGKTEAAVAELKAKGAKATAHTVDLTKESDCRRLVAEVDAKHGRLDILVNNAGINIRKTPQEMTLDEWTTVMNTNLTSAFVCSQAAYPLMKRGGGGKVINIGSMLSLFGVAFAPAYGASKGGLVQLTKSCASAWARDNIQVNAVLPGWIDTELTTTARSQVKGLHESVVNRTPAHRWGVPDDLAGIAVFLASAASDFVTGTAIPVDGGFSAQG